MRDGDISEMYNGVTSDAIPIATPTAILPKISRLTSGAVAVPTAPRAKIIAATMMTFRRPKWSDKSPPRAAPITAPISTALITKPTVKSDKTKSCLMKRIAPEITPVS